MGETYRNRKNGLLYYKISEAIDCTNSRDGTPVVIYRSERDAEKLFVREKAEFEQKFERMTDGAGE